MTRHRLFTPLILIGCALAAPSGCNLFDENQRPCSAEGACQDDFICSDGLCLRRGEVPTGGRCDQVSDCVEAPLCADAYCAQPCTSDINCGDHEGSCQDGLCRCGGRCSEACEASATDRCGDGQICFHDGVRGFCQPGACSHSRDCPEQYTCVEFGDTGLCSRICLVLEQTGCEDLPPPVSRPLVGCKPPASSAE